MFLFLFETGLTGKSELLLISNLQIKIVEADGLR